MRAGLRRHLIEHVEATQVRAEDGSIDYARSRWYEPAAPGPKTPKPYGVIQDAGEETGEQWADAVHVVALYPVVDHASYTRDLDPFVADVQRALDHSRFSVDDEQFYAVKRSESADSQDERLGGIYRRLVYEVWRLNALVPPSDTNHPATALRDWTGVTFPDVQVDPLTWQPSNTKPGVFWRLDAMPRIVEQWPTWALLEARMRGHVLAPAPGVRAEWALKLATRLAVTRRLTLTEGTGEEATEHPMDIVQVAQDPGAHPMRTGQVVATVQYGVLVPEPVPAPAPLNNVTVMGLFEEETV